MSFLLGANLLTALMFWFGLIFAVSLIGATISAVLYHRIIYPKFIRTKYKPYTPSCSIIIPCKGVPKDFKPNLESFLNLDYPDYEVLYAVESENDPAVPVIKEVVAQDPKKCKLIIAGLSKKCAQKNYNQLAAIKETKNTEVYVFADSDIGPTSDWLKELILPLSDSNNSATTGFRWQYSSNGTLGEQAHTLQNNSMYVAFCAAALLSKLDIMWGGSMAIKKTTFEKLEVAKTWAETVVDDFSLSELIMKKGKRALLVTTCVTDTDDALDTVGKAIRWMERQTMFLKYFHTPTWLLIGVPLMAVAMLNLLWLPISIVMSKLSLSSFIYLGGVGPLLMVVGTIVSTFMYPLLGKNPTYFRFVMSVPVGMYSIFMAMLRTVFTNTIIWGNVKYKTRISGKVASIERF